MEVLVINSGSSSVKFEAFSMDPCRSLLRGEVERIGTGKAALWIEEGHKPSSGDAGTENRETRAIDAPDHRRAMEAVVTALKATRAWSAAGDLSAVGHRVVHGGDMFAGPVTIDDGVLEDIRSLSLLAPVHTKANVAGIEAAREHLPHATHVAIFDTTFHRTMPRHAREYALPRGLAREFGIRRYGFHGISHAYVARRTAELLDRPLEDLKLITLHLGNGASIAAIDGGRSVDTSMGMTPLEGLVMGTRSGDVDPAVPMLLGEITGRSREEVHRMLNFESGLKGLTGEADMREVHRMADDGDPDARLALELYCYRARKYLGGYYAVLGRVDAVVFTAGVGENDAEVRLRICSGLDRLGIRIDEAANARGAGERFVSAPGGEVAVLVVPTDEESEIAGAAYACAQQARQPIHV